jgi:hypothetical protein
MSGIKDTFADRASVYGNFRLGSQVEAEIMKTIRDRYETEHGYKINPVYDTWINHIAIKLSRISMTPDHVDSWHDIAGYATLVEKELRKNAKSK